MKWGHGELDVFVGDVWELATQAIVSPMNAELIPTVRLGADIVRQAGQDVLRELGEHSKVKIGGAVRTSGGKLRASHLIHVAIGSLSERVTLQSLEEGLTNAFAVCRDKEIGSVAIPMMGVGSEELLINTVAQVTIRESLESLRKSKLPVRIVIAVQNEAVEKQVLSMAKYLIENPS